MATEVAWLNGNRLMERRKRKCALTSTGLLMEGLSGISCARGTKHYLRCLQIALATSGSGGSCATAEVCSNPMRFELIAAYFSRIDSVRCEVTRPPNWNFLAGLHTPGYGLL